MKTTGYELGSTIQGRLDAIPMTAVEREAAIDAMEKAFAIVDACAWIAQKLRHFGGSLSQRPTVAQ